MCLSCLLQKIMRKEYIKAQNRSTFKEQLALIKNTHSKAGGLGVKRGSLRCQLGHSSHFCFTASTQHSCSLGVPPSPCSGIGGFMLGTMQCPSLVSFYCCIEEKYGKHALFAYFLPHHRPAAPWMLQRWYDCSPASSVQGSPLVPAVLGDVPLLPAARDKNPAKDPVQQ